VNDETFGYICTLCARPLHIHAYVLSIRTNQYYTTTKEGNDAATLYHVTILAASSIIPNYTLL